MCKGLGLYIVNGRVRGDSLGRLTQCSVLGSSVVDYAITDIEPQYINAFTVCLQQPLSDHSQITLFLKKSLSTTVNPNPEARQVPLLKRDSSENSSHVSDQTGLGNESRCIVHSSSSQHYF